MIRTSAATDSATQMDDPHGRDELDDAAGPDEPADLGVTMGVAIQGYPASR